MRLTRLHLEHFRSHEHLDLDLSLVDHAAIVGSNGAGKSSILQSIAWVLWGEGSSDQLIDYGASTMGVTLTFELGGSTYVVARGRERNRQSWLTFSKDGAKPETHTIAATQLEVDRVLGMGHDAFSASVYAPQGQIGALVALRPGERKALLGSLLGLGSWEAWRKEAGTLVRVLAAQAQSAAGALEELERQVVEHKTQLISDPAGAERKAAELVAALAAGERALDAAIEHEKIEERVRLCGTLVAQMAKLKQDGQRAKERNAQREKLRAELAGRDAAAARAQTAAAAKRSYDDAAAHARAGYEAARREQQQTRLQLADAQRSARTAESEAERLAAQADELRQRARAPHDTSGRCYACGQALDVESHAKVAANLLAQADALDEPLARALTAVVDYSRRVDEHTRQLATAVTPEPPKVPLGDHDPAELAAAEAELRRLTEIEGQLRGMGPPDDVAAMQADWTRLRDQVAELPKDVGVGESPAVVRARLAKLQADLSLTREWLAAHQRAQARLAQLETQLTAGWAEHAHVAQRQRALTVCAAAFSRDGIPAMILDGNVGAIEAAANQHLEDLGSHMRLTLTTQRENKAGGVTETLGILVDDGAFERPIESYSGGEAYRVHISLRLAIAEALAGQTLDCLLIDEVTDLDSAGVQSLVEILRALPRQVLLISHDSELTSAMPQQIAVSREGPLAPSVVTVQ